MAVTTLAFWLGLCILTAVMSFGLLWLIGVFLPPERARETSAPQSTGISTFLFNEDLLFDHHSGALPDSVPSGASLAWTDLLGWLSTRFAGLPRRLSDLEIDQPVLALPRDTSDTAQIHILRTEHSTRIVLSDPPHPCPATRHAMLEARSQMDRMTEAFEAAPYPICKTSIDGAILWQNTACATTFAPGILKMNVAAPDPGDSSVTRFSIPHPGLGKPQWFEVHSTTHHSEVLHHATDITNVLRAETTQKVFVQTLTKTFAYLTIGLAVFDRNRQLALFNPALVDLTGLSAEFLSAQPELMGFFDNLRNRQVMPEPRSYASWRAQVTDVIESARGGLYQETWSLPNDVTYRVTGRPHPDGAVAFLFEDISAEVMLSRRYRSQLDLRQSVLDRLPEAVMVFGPNNVLSFCNAAASDLLGIDPDSSFADMSVSDLMSACQNVLPAQTVWHEVEASLRSRTQGKALRKTANIAPDTTLTYRVEVLPGGARMLILHSQARAQPARTLSIAG